MQHLNEQELIQALAKGDESAFRWLVDHYRNKVFHTILNIVQDSYEAEDATQEVFISVFESVSSFRGQSSLSTWIYQVAIRKALDKVRRRNTRRRLQQWLPGWMPEEKRSANNEFHHPGIAMDNKEKAAILFNAIRALPEKQKIAFTLIKVQGMSYEEAGIIMQQGIKAIESLISRAKQNLQKQLEHYHNTK